MEATLSERLEVERRRRFVGRQDELRWVADWLDDEAAREAVLWVHGPAGVGKTAFVKRVLDLARTRGLSARSLDARDVGPHPSAVRETILGPAGAGEDTVIDLTAGPELLVVDTYEQWHGLDERVRRDFLPELPVRTRVVLAGRFPPGAGWRSDAGWPGLVHSVGLRNLAPDESRESRVVTV